MKLSKLFLFTVFLFTPLSLSAVQTIKVPSSRGRYISYVFDPENEHLIIFPEFNKPFNTLSIDPATNLELLDQHWNNPETTAEAKLIVLLQFLCVLYKQLYIKCRIPRPNPKNVPLDMFFRLFYGALQEVGAENGFLYVAITCSEGLLRLDQLRDTLVPTLDSCPIDPTWRATSGVPIATQYFVRLFDIFSQLANLDFSVPLDMANLTTVKDSVISLFNDMFRTRLVASRAAAAAPAPVVDGANYGFAADGASPTPALSDRPIRGRGSRGGYSRSRAGCSGAPKRPRPAAPGEYRAAFPGPAPYPQTSVASDLCIHAVMPPVLADLPAVEPGYSSTSVTPSVGGLSEALAFSSSAASLPRPLRFRRKSGPVGPLMGGRPSARRGYPPSSSGGVSPCSTVLGVPVVIPALSEPQPEIAIAPPLGFLPGTQLRTEESFIGALRATFGDTVVDRVLSQGRVGGGGGPTELGMISALEEAFGVGSVAEALARVARVPHEFEMASGTAYEQFFDPQPADFTVASSLEHPRASSPTVRDEGCPHDEDPLRYDPRYAFLKRPDSSDPVGVGEEVVGTDYDLLAGAPYPSGWQEVLGLSPWAGSLPEV